jgi:hypothetical protein
MTSTPATVVTEAEVKDLLAAHNLDDVPLAPAADSYMPSIELLSSVINAVFWASLAEEEGRPANVRVRFAEPDANTCRFKPRPLSAHELRKLSPLMDGAQNTLLVSGTGNLVGVSSGLAFAMSVIATGPGRLVVFDKAHVVGLLEDGAWNIVGGSDFSVVNLLAKIFESTTAHYPARVLKAGLLVRMIIGARRAQRGACFIVLERASDSAGIGSIAFPVESFGPFSDLGARLESGLSTADGSEMHAEMATQVTSAASGIDGATVICAEEFKLLGFGAKIDAPDMSSKLSLKVLPDPESTQVSVSRLGGMRHQSAARLVALNHTATVITVSQDGPVSLFAWTDNCVVVVKSLERYLEGAASS